VEIHLTDDELWRAIVDNTNAMSALIEQQVDLDAGVGVPDSESRAKLMLSNVQMINKYGRDYRQLTAEVRRRYPGI
jgi:hypothetical protein